MSAKPCRICEHLERDFISKLLINGLSPRAIYKRVGDTTRKSLVYHRDVCLKEETTERNEA